MCRHFEVWIVQQIEDRNINSTLENNKSNVCR